MFDELLTRGVEEIIIKESLEKRLATGPIRVKLGIDPTGNKIHIGRAVILRKLKKFQEQGHTIILIIGDFTALIGDPSDKLAKRPMLTKKSIEDNLRSYKAQLGKIIDLDKVEFHYNSEWLKDLRFEEICKLAESFSVQQMIARRNFKDRFDNQNEISLREFMYPLMQGYDSVMVRADLEIGGHDQLFNLKAGRTIQKHYGIKEQDILTCSMLEGTDGRKMSTSWGNVINISDEPIDMFGKIMSLNDDLIIKYFLLATEVKVERINEYKLSLDKGENPKKIKMILAEEIVGLYASKEDTQKAKDSFIETFEKGGVPEDIKEVSYPKGTILSEIFIKEQVISSKTEFRRLLKENAIKIMEKNEETVLGEDLPISESSLIYKIGKRRFLKIILKG